jgi:hypothetical protein
MAATRPVSEYLTNNTVRAYFELDQAMVKAHFEKTVERQAFAESTARTLLANADLPLLFRARACMVLGCNNDPESDYLEMAQQGVRMAELMVSRCEPGPGPWETRILEDCKIVLKEAQAAHDRHVERMEGEEEEDGKEEREGGEGEEGGDQEKSA